MNRRGQGISINVIVIAAIALLVLVILSVLVLRGGGNITRGTSCEQLGGACFVSGEMGSIANPCGNEAQSGYVYDRSGVCTRDPFTEEARYCCRKI